MIQYYLSRPQPLTGYLQLQMTFAAEAAALVALQLPAWRPGRYELQNFGQKIRALTVTDAAGQPLAVRKVTKDRWEIASVGADALVVSYEFYAHQLDAGGSWADEDQVYLNPVNALPLVVGREAESCRLTLDIPVDWLIACALPVVAADSGHARTLLAASYDELADSPLMASPTLQHLTYDVGETAFHVWVQGATGPLPAERLTADFRAFSETQVALFGGFPCPAYHFLVQLLPVRFYHGVEHTASTVLALGPSEQLGTWGLYKELLGVASHELFHVWNVKLIRPAELQPYDYAREQYFRTGYVAEGLTTYYGDLLLARAGVFSPEQYLAELNTTLRKHFDDDGARFLSVADASMDLWLDGYKAGAPHRKVSIYHKGALAALLLDLQLRAETGGQKSLDDVMRALWVEFGQTGRGYTAVDYRRVVETVAGQSQDAYFADVIEGTAPLEPLLTAALAPFGYQLRVEENLARAEGHFGFRLNQQKELPDVIAIAPASPAESGLALEDEVVALNGRKVENNLQLLLHEAGDSVELTVFRQKRLLAVRLQATGARFFRKLSIEPDLGASDAARAWGQAWFSGGRA